MDHVTYTDLVERFGRPMAFDLLLQIEKMARIQADITRMDEGERLKTALNALNSAEQRRA